MATARFESYVRETLADGVKERRAALKKAFDDEKAKIEAKLAALEEIATEAVKAANAKIDAQARKWGWTVREDSDPAFRSDRSFRSSCSSRFDAARTQYERGDSWSEHSYVCGKVREAQLALREFDAAVEKAARRLVVCKMDLHMKPEAFDKMMADAIAKLLK